MFTKFIDVPHSAYSKRTAKLDKRRPYVGDHGGFIETMSFNNHQIARARKDGPRKPSKGKWRRNCSRKFGRGSSAPNRNRGGKCFF